MKKKLAIIIIIVFICQCFVSAEELIQVSTLGGSIDTILGVEKGQCGDNLEWSMSVTARRELNITGTGDMYNYDEGTAPWSTGASNVYFDDGVTYIGNYAFYNFTNLEEIEIPDSVTEIGYCTFKNCTSLETVSIPDNVTIIGSSAFEGCSNLSYVTLPSNIKSIYHFTFAMCKSLEEIEIIDGVKEIGQGAFTNCSNLREIYIPDTVEKIDSRTFYGCNSLGTVYYGGSKTQWKDISISSGNSALETAEIIYLSEDDVQEIKICFMCKEKIFGDNFFYNEDGNLICNLCNSEEVQEPDTKTCFICEREIDSNDELYDENDNLICQDCYNELQNIEEQEKILCQYCNNEFELTTNVYDDEGNIVCPNCNESLTEKDIETPIEIECPHCGEIYEDSEDIYNADGYAVCPYCNKPIDSTDEIPEDTELEFAASDWAMEEVVEAYQNNLIPNEMLDEALYKTVSREEFAAIAVKLYESIVGEGPMVDIDDTPFTDCNSASEYNNYIAVAYKLGITKGISHTAFSPYKDITREQLATMLARVSMPPDNRTISKFADDSEISNYAKDYVYFMAMHGIIKGVGNNSFAPKDTATREQAILMSLRIFKVSEIW